MFFVFFLHKASVHLPRIGHSTKGFNWYGTERLIRKHLASRGIPTFMYPGEIFPMPKCKKWYFSERKDLCQFPLTWLTDTITAEQQRTQLHLRHPSLQHQHPPLNHGCTTQTSRLMRRRQKPLAPRVPAPQVSPVSWGESVCFSTTCLPPRGRRWPATLSHILSGWVCSSQYCAVELLYSVVGQAFLSHPFSWGTV